MKAYASPPTSAQICHNRGYVSVWPNVGLVQDRVGSEEIEMQNQYPHFRITLVIGVLLCVVAIFFERKRT